MDTETRYSISVGHIEAVSHFHRRLLVKVGVPRLAIRPFWSVGVMPRRGRIPYLPAWYGTEFEPFRSCSDPFRSRTPVLRVALPELA